MAVALKNLRLYAALSACTALIPLHVLAADSQPAQPTIEFNLNALDEMNHEPAAAPAPHPLVTSAPSQPAASTPKLIWNVGPPGHVLESQHAKKGKPVHKKHPKKKKTEAAPEKSAEKAKPATPETVKQKPVEKTALPKIPTAVPPIPEKPQAPQTPSKAIPPVPEKPATTMPTPKEQPKAAPPAAIPTPPPPAPKAVPAPMLAPPPIPPAPKPLPSVPSVENSEEPVINVPVIASHELPKEVTSPAATTPSLPPLPAESKPLIPTPTEPPAPTPLPTLSPAPPPPAPLPVPEKVETPAPATQKAPDESAAVKATAKALSEPAPTTPAETEPAKPAAGQTAPALRIAFKSTETTVPLSIQSQLDDVAKKLTHNENLRVTLVAYASAVGDQVSTARRVSLSRALSVRAYLIDAGVSNLRINVQAEGDKNPAGNPDRVDVIVQESDDKKS